MDRWYRRNFDSRHPRDVYPDARAVESRCTDDDRGHRYCGDAHSGDLRLDARALRFNASGLRLLTGCHPFVHLVEVCLGTHDPALHVDEGLLQAAGRNFILRLDFGFGNLRFGEELVGASCGEIDDGLGLVGDVVDNLVSPRHSTLVVAGVQSGC